LSDGVSLELAKHYRVVLFAETSHEFEGDDEKGNTDAGYGEHAVRGDVPGAGEEACTGS